MGKSRTPYGLEVIQSCLTCPAREEGLFCQLAPEALRELNTIRQSSLYPPGAVLFVEGQPCGGLFVLCSGKVKLTTSSSRGRTLIVRVASAGEVLGLSALMSNSTFEVSAETLEPTQVNYMSREDFLRFLHNHGEVSVRVAQQLSTELRRAYNQVARIALAPTARSKLAGLLLEWAGRDAEPTAKGDRFQLQLTHEEIGELIGSSRETVNRILNDFRRKGLIHCKGATIVVRDRDKLEGILP